MLIYWLFFLAAVSWGMLAVIGLILAYISIGDANEKERTHFAYQIRGFWLFVLYFILITIFVWGVLIGFFGAFIPFFGFPGEQFQFLFERAGGDVIPYLEIRDTDFWFMLNGSSRVPYLEFGNEGFHFLLDNSHVRGMRLEFGGNGLSLIGRLGLAVLPYAMLNIWALIRFIKGVVLLLRKRPVGNPKTWWV